VLQATGVVEEAWTAAEITSFSLQVYVHNHFNRNAFELGRLIYTTPLRYCIQFVTHCRDVPKVGVQIVGESNSPVTLGLGRIDEEAPPVDVPDGVPTESEVSSADTDDESLDDSGAAVATAGGGWVYLKTCTSGQYEILGWRWRRELAQRHCPPHQ
jgi:hypothetical protein